MAKVKIVNKKPALTAALLIKELKKIPPESIVMVVKPLVKNDSNNFLCYDIIASGPSKAESGANLYVLQISDD